MELQKRRYFIDERGVRHALEDADTTIRPDGTKVRFVGYDAEETDQLTKNDDGTFTFERGEVGGDLFTETVADIIDEGNFKDVQYTGEKGYYGRDLGNLVNPEGEKLDATLYSAGIAKLAPWTTAENTKLKLEGDMYRKFFGDANDPYAKYREALDEERQTQGLRFKTKALDESYYDPNFHNDVAFRDNNRTIDNKPRSVLSGAGDAFGMGFDGIKEGAFGYLDAIGQMTEIEMLENLGEQGVMRARDRLTNTPDLVLDYKEVDSLSKGFQYVLNNAAMSAPYMITTFAALASATVAAPLVGLKGVGILAAAGVPNSIVYAGQTWNDMEGELGFSQFLAASMSGVGQATLEYLAIPALMAPVKVFSKAGQDKIIKTLQNKGMSKAEATETFKLAFAKNQKDYLTTITKTTGAKFTPNDFASFSASSLGKAAGRGTLVETLTEVGQESLQMATAAGFSDKKYSAQEVRDRLINAAIAGGTIGGGLSSAGNVYRQGKNKLNAKLYTRADQDRINTFQQYHLGKVQEDGRVKSINERIVDEDRLAARETRDNATIEFNKSDLIQNAAVELNAEKEKVKIAQQTVDDVQKKLEDEQAFDSELKSLNIDGKTYTAKTLRRDLQNDLKTYKKNLKFQQKKVNELEKKLSDAEKDTEILANLEVNKAGQNNLVSVLADNYDRAVKGARNYFKNNNRAADYITNAALGVSKMFRALERVAIKPEDAVKDDTIMDIIGRVFGALGDATNSGQNFKEFQEEIIYKTKSLVNEALIRTSLLGKVGLMKHGDALAISKRIIEFAEKNDNTLFAAFFAERMLNNYLTLQTNGIAPIDITFEKFINKASGSFLSEEDINLLDQLGFSVSSNEIMLSEVKQVQGILDNKRYFNNEVSLKNIYSSEVERQELSKLYEAGMMLKKAYDYNWALTNKTINEEGDGRTKLEYSPDAWWKHQGFDWKKAKKNPAGFKAFLRKELDYGAEQAKEVYDRIAKRGETTINIVSAVDNEIGEVTSAKYSLLNPNNSGRPFIFSENAAKLYKAKGISNWTNNNLFETMNKTAIDTGRYVSNAKYFGEGGKKLHRMFLRIAKNGNVPPQVLQQFAYYIKSSIDSANGNFNRIESTRMAALNSFLSSWAVLAGLPLSMPSSIPEFGMVYFDIKDDEMFAKASSTLMKQLSGSFTNALDAEVTRAKKLLAQSKLDVSQSSVVDRLATGERDIAFARLHEAFFRGVGITGVTQIQRRIEAVIGLDAIKHAFDVLDLAPTKPVNRQIPVDGKPVAITVSEFNFEKFTQIELEMYNQLTSLGINVQDMMTLFQDLDSVSRDNLFEITDGIDVKSSIEQVDEDGVVRFRDLSQRERAFRKVLKQQYQRDFINTRGAVGEFDQYLANEADALVDEIDSAISNALYRYINERIQLPGHSNRPLMYQDPHYQLLFQFQGFISTFTSNIIPKLYDRAIARGHVKAKYDAFALITLLIVLGGMSQYLKDLIKFGKPSPYLDDAGYMQRAVYASGVLGTYERIADAIVPLYPQRNEGIEGFINAIVGEAGPGARNIQNVLSGTGQLLEGETERAANTLFKTAPLIAPATGARRAGADILHGDNPLRNAELPTAKDVKTFFLGEF